MEIENTRSSKCFLISTLAFLLCSCGGSQHPRALSGAGTTGVPQSIQLRSEVRLATLHFPPGIYSLSATDKIGYYYRSPRKVMQHTAAGAVPHEGGIFVSKRNHAKLRGYVYLGGGVTHVGNFSRADYSILVGRATEDIPAEGY
jgi:hypothetical protein